MECKAMLDRALSFRHAMLEGPRSEEDKSLGGISDANSEQVAGGCHAGAMRSAAGRTGRVLYAPRILPGSFKKRVRNR